TESATAVFTLAQNLGSFNNQISASSMTTVNVVDASISIAPDDVNEVGQSHTFVVTVTQSINGASSAAAGASVTVTLTNANGAASNPAGPFTGTTDSNGQFQVTFTSNSAGTVTGHAAADVVFSGPPTVTVHRETDSTHGSSGDAVKTFVAGSLRWLKIDGDTNQPLAGATFVVTATGGTAASSGHSPLSASLVDHIRL